MNYRLIFCLLCIVAMVGIVSADTLIVYTTGNEDGDIYRYDGSEATFFALRDGAGTDVDKNPSYPFITIVSQTTSGKYTQNQRAYFGFNTSALPDDCTIDSAYISLYGLGSNTRGLGEPTTGFTKFTPATNGTVVAADYQTFQDTLLTDTKGYWDINGYGRNNFTLNALGLSNVSKTAYTNLMGRFAWDYLNSTTGLSTATSTNSKIYFTGNSYSGLTRDPLISITYTPAAGGDTTPPASITSFTNNSVTCTEENVTWVNPTDADFNHTQMYKDNVWQINETNTTTFHKFTGLNSWQSYTYSTHTCDITGNCNTTWVNQTVASSPICKIITYIRQFYLPAEAVIR
jgi:hypothetical protein